LRTCQGVARRAKTDDVLGQALQVVALVRRDAPAAMDVEPGMLPTTEHVRPLRGEKTFAYQKGNYPRAEHLFERLEADVRKDVEQP
jgi:hypothetical protein